MNKEYLRNNANRFYMSSGGYTPTIKVQSAAIPLSTTPPAVNFRRIEKNVLIRHLRSSLSPLLMVEYIKLFQLSIIPSVLM